MKSGRILLAVIILAIIGVIISDIFYVSKRKKQFLDLEKQRIFTSNKLATAKIVQENINHVKDLVLKNMDFTPRIDTVGHETYLFELISSWINDLKLGLISVKPVRPTIRGRVTTYSYDIDIEGDFFKFGELCAKFENSRRIVSLETFNISLLGGNKKDKGGPGSNKISARIRINTYRIKKNTKTVPINSRQ